VREKWIVRFEEDACEQSWVVSVCCGVRRERQWIREKRGNADALRACG